MSDALKVGIHKAWHGVFSPFLLRYETILEHNGIVSQRMDASDSSFWEDVAKLDLFIYRWQHYHDDQQLANTILPVIERDLGVACFPNIATSWHYDDKIKQYYLLQQHGFPMIKSWIFWSRDAAVQWLESSASFPLVFKLKGGASSSNVVMVQNVKKAKSLIKSMFTTGIRSGHLPISASTRLRDFRLRKEIRRIGGNLLRYMRSEDSNPYWQLDKNYVYFQEFLPNNDFDTRVTVIGDRAFAFRRMNRKDDFRSSGSGIISYDADKIDPRFVSKAFEVSSALGFQSMAYDFMYGPDREVTFCEISYDYMDAPVYNCPGHWDASGNWHEGKLWPQYCHLSDALKTSDLIQPEMSGALPSGIRVV